MNREVFDQAFHKPTDVEVEALVKAARELVQTGHSDTPRHNKWLIWNLGDALEPFKTIAQDEVDG